MEGAAVNGGGSQPGLARTGVDKGLREPEIVFGEDAPVNERAGRGQLWMRGVSTGAVGSC